MNEIYEKAQFQLRPINYILIKVDKNKYMKINKIKV